VVYLRQSYTSASKPLPWLAIIASKLSTGVFTSMARTRYHRGTRVAGQIQQPATRR
jgi:hypothetical protein